MAAKVKPDSLPAARGDLLVFPLGEAAIRTFYLVTRRADFIRPAARLFFDFAAQFYPA